MNDYIIKEDNLSIAWAKLFKLILTSSKHELSPFLISISSSDNGILENLAVREQLNLELKRKRIFTVETVASTIFPQNYWNKNAPRTYLYSRYLKNFPKIKSYPQNYSGTYFQRLISFNSMYNKNESINQIEELIDGWHNGVRRRSFYQAAIFDPRKDQSRKPLQGFPCMRHISFNINDNSSGTGLEIIGIYATQTVFEKAYGNYLGLCNLGQFMAHEMGINFIGLKCISARLILKNGNNSIADLKLLETNISQILDGTSQNV